MLIKSFRIKNFKGIQDLKIELSGDIVTLVGLNESGKTTILEALSWYVTKDKNVSDVIGHRDSSIDIHNIIPKSKNAGFTGDVTIESIVSLESDDFLALKEFYQSEYNFEFDTESCKKELSITASYRFIDSKYEGGMNYWNINFPITYKDGRKIKKIEIGKHMHDDEIDKSRWMAGVMLLKDRHPKIAYFPTFIFEFPDRIYLGNSKSDDKKNAYYKRIIQDILDNHDRGLNIETHILGRIDRVRGEGAVRDFALKFSSSPEKKQIDSVIQVISNEMSRIIFGSWNNIFGRRADGKRLQIDWSADVINEDVYIEISIVDGMSRYSLSERSLGFRWFFPFLLFTQFRKSRKKADGTIFLFDEPAANLHSRAQMKLLESFSRISGPMTRIIYSTHSHYMINPLWLESAYVIKNISADVELENGADSFSFGETDIKATKYRSFVGSYPNQVTYFQPVLDALDVGASPLLSTSKAIIVEGKFDYHPIVLLRKVSGKDASMGIYPVNGAANAGRLISLFRGWGVSFRILLDDDTEGRKAKQRYIEDYLLDEVNVMTLGNVDSHLLGKSFESIYKDDVNSILKARYDVDKPTKRHYSLLFQELLGTQDTKEGLEETLKAFEPISIWMDEFFDGNIAKASS